MPGSSSSNSKAMDQNSLKRVREVVEEEKENKGRRVRRKMEEARNHFSRNQQSLMELMEENERIAEDVVEDLEEKVDELTDALEEKAVELERKEKLLRIQNQAVLDLKESHMEEMNELKVKLNQRLCKGVDAEKFNKEIMSTLNPDLVEAVETSLEQGKKILELEEKLRKADEKEERRGNGEEKVKVDATETLKRLRGMNVTMVKTAEKPMEIKKMEKQPGLNMVNIQAALNLMNATKNNSGKRELEKESDEDRSAKTLKLDEDHVDLKVTLNEEESEEEGEDDDELEVDDEEEVHDEEEVLDPFWFCGPPSSELLRREEERLAREREEQRMKELNSKKEKEEEAEMEKKKNEKAEMERKEKEKEVMIEVAEGGCAPCSNGWVHLCSEDILAF